MMQALSYVYSCDCVCIYALPTPTAMKAVPVLFVCKNALSLLVIRRSLRVVRRLKSDVSILLSASISLVVILVMLERGGSGSIGCLSISALKSPQLCMKRKTLRALVCSVYWKQFNYVTMEGHI